MGLFLLEVFMALASRKNGITISAGKLDSGEQGFIIVGWEDKKAKQIVLISEKDKSRVMEAVKILWNDMTMAKAKKGYARVSQKLLDKQFN